MSTNYLEYTKCPLCNKNYYKVVKKGLNFSKISLSKIKKIFKSSSDIMINQIVKCLNCDFIYINPRIKSKIIIEGYKNVIDKEFITQNNQRIFSFRKSLKTLTKIIPIKRESKILDVGTASGEFLIACKTKFINAEGIEPSKWLVRFAKKKSDIKIYNGDFIKKKFSKKYDIIFFWDVLEHIANLQKTVKKINSIHSESGYLIINIPDHDSLIRKLMKFKWPFSLSVHLHYFTKKTLTKLLNKNYEFIYSKPHWQYLELGYILFRASKIFYFFKYFEKIVYYLKMNHIRIKYNMGQTMFVFKKK